MAKKPKKEIVAELTALGVDFDARESRNNLAEQLKIEKRNRKPSPQPVSKPKEENLDDPLSPDERRELEMLERMARKGRKIDQPTPAEMIKLGSLRKRAKL